MFEGLYVFCEDFKVLFGFEQSCLILISIEKTVDNLTNAAIDVGCNREFECNP